jgi:hypothetical protein
VHLAVEAGLVGLALQALDGTKIQAVASGRTGWSRERMEKLLAALDKEADQTEKQVEQESAPLPRFVLPETLQAKESLRAAVQQGLKTLDQRERAHFHPHEPEAQRMQCDGKNRFGYNAQAVVDSQRGVAMAADVTPHENDFGQLAPMTQAALQNAGPTAQAVTVADTGYSSGPDLQNADQAQLKILCRPQEGAPSKDKPYHACHFHYDSAGDTVTCPRGERLQFERARQKKGQSVRVFRCHCRDCPVQAQCSREKGGRSSTAHASTALVQAMRERLKDPIQKEQLEKRGRIVELHFARVKEQAGFRRWTMRGLENVRAQWDLVCAALNLRILIQAWQWKIQTQPA